MAKGTGRYHPPKILIMVPEFFIPHILVQDPLSNSEDSLEHLGLSRINFRVNIRRENKKTGRHTVRFQNYGVMVRWL